MDLVLHQSISSLVREGLCTRYRSLTLYRSLTFHRSNVFCRDKWNNICLRTDSEWKNLHYAWLFRRAWSYHSCCRGVVSAHSTSKFTCLSGNITCVFIQAEVVQVEAITMFGGCGWATATNIQDIL